MIHQLLDNLEMGEEARPLADLDGSKANIDATLLTLAERTQSDRSTDHFLGDFETGYTEFETYRVQARRSKQKADGEGRGGRNR